MGFRAGPWGLGGFGWGWVWVWAVTSFARDSIPSLGLCCACNTSILDFKQVWVLVRGLNSSNHLRTVVGLLPTEFPPYVAPSLMPSWSHPCVHSTLHLKPSVESRAHTCSLIQTHRGLRLMVQLLPSPDGPLGAYLLFHGDDARPVFWGHYHGSSTKHAIWRALLHGMQSVDTFHSTPLLILLPNHAIASHMFNLGKHQFLPQASELTTILSSFLSNAIEGHTVMFRWYSTKWANLPGRDIITAMTQSSRESPPPQKPLSRKEEAYRTWASQPLPRRSFAASISITTPNGNKTGPFTTGALSHKNRRLFSAALQLTNRHCFDAGYSLRFRPTAGDELACPCNFSTDNAYLNEHSDGPAVGGRPTRGRTTTAARNRRNVSFEELQRRYEDPLDDGTNLSDLSGYGEDGERPGSSDRGGRLVYHTVKHVLTECPLTSQARDEILHNSSLNWIFGTEEGGKALGSFLLHTQTLLRPLPPRPDPP